MMIDQNQTMYILDTSNYRVLRWQLGDTFGTVIAAGHGSGSLLTQIGTSYAMCFDNQKNIYISENSNHRVTKWTNGNNTVGQLVTLFFFLE
jgi:sugar lactone lactonase YvrE